MKTLKVSLKAIVFILATAASLTVNAADANNKNGKQNTSVVNVKHTGDLDNNPIVELNFENPNDERVKITLKDQAGVIVYEETFIGKSYAKKFMLEADFADANPVITVKFLNSDRVETYQVASTATKVNGTTIVKL